MEKIVKKPATALSGYALDCAVAKALGYQLDAFDLGWRILAPRSGYRHIIGFIPRDEVALQQSILHPWSPSINWALGGPIIHHEEIQLRVGMTGKWYALGYKYDRDEEIEGSTPLEAAMRCFVASRLGEEITDESL